MSEYNIQMNKYNALNAGYDQLYPQPMKHARTHAKDGSDPITPADIGAYSKTEADTLLQNKAPSNIAAYSDIRIRVTDGKSIQEAIDSIPQNLNGHNVIIDVYGSHVEDVAINGFSGYAYFVLRFVNAASLIGSISVFGPGKIAIVNAGDGTSMLTNTSGGICITSLGGGVVECRGISITTIGAIAANVDSSSRLTLFNCNVKATGSGNYEAAIEAQHASEILANNVTIESGTVCGLCATYTSLIRFKGTNNATTKSTTYSGGEVVTLS